MRPSSLDALLAAVRAFVSQWPGEAPRAVRIILVSGEKIVVPVTPAPVSPAAETFIPTPFQSEILAALDHRALRTDALGAAVGDRSRLFKRPHGIQELIEQGEVVHDKRLGYYRVDAPPPELENEE